MECCELRYPDGSLGALVVGSPPQGQDVADPGLRDFELGGYVRRGVPLPCEPPDVVQQLARPWGHASRDGSVGGAVPDLTIPFQSLDADLVQGPLLRSLQVVAGYHPRPREPEALGGRVAEQFLVFQHEFPDLVFPLMFLVVHQASLSLRLRSVQSVQCVAPP